MVINIISLLSIIILWFSCISLISVILSIDQSHLIILVSLAIVNPRWSLTKQLTTASSYLLYQVKSYYYYEDVGEKDVDLSISTAAADEVGLVKGKGVLHCVVPKVCRYK